MQRFCCNFADKETIEHNNHHGNREKCRNHRPHQVPDERDGLEAGAVCRAHRC